MTQEDFNFVISAINFQFGRYEKKAINPKMLRDLHSLQVDLKNYLMRQTYIENRLET